VLKVELSPEFLFFFLRRTSGAETGRVRIATAAQPHSAGPRSSDEKKSNYDAVVNIVRTPALHVWAWTRSGRGAARLQLFCLCFIFAVPSDIGAVVTPPRSPPFRIFTAPPGCAALGGV